MNQKILVSALTVGFMLASGAYAQEQTTEQKMENEGEMTSSSDVAEQCAEVGVSLKKPGKTATLSPREKLKAELARQDDEEAKRKEQLCADKRGTPLFLRADLAYSVTGVDCFGSQPNNYSTIDGKEPTKGRAPASIESRLQGVTQPSATIDEIGIDYEPVQ